MCMDVIDVGGVLRLVSSVGGAKHVPFEMCITVVGTRVRFAGITAVCLSL